MKGKIVPVPFSFTSIEGTKLRPALVLFEDRDDKRNKLKDILPLGV